DLPRAARQSVRPLDELHVVVHHEVVADLRTHPPPRSPGLEHVGHREPRRPRSAASEAAPVTAPPLTLPARRRRVNGLCRPAPPAAAAPARAAPPPPPPRARGGGGSRGPPGPSPPPPAAKTDAPFADPRQPQRKQDRDGDADPGSGVGGRWVASGRTGGLA